MGAIVQKSAEILRKRLIFRSWHRGCKETDLVLGRFCDRYINDFNEADLARFDAILEEDDADLYKWLTGALPIPERMKDNPVFELLLHFDVSRG